MDNVKYTMLTESQGPEVFYGIVAYRETASGVFVLKRIPGISTDGEKVAHWVDKMNQDDLPLPHLEDSVDEIRDVI